MIELRPVLAVGLGGFVGSAARYLLGGWVQRAWPAVAFPFGTLAVNTVGCLAIGATVAVLETRQLFSPAARLFWMIGVLGGFTTFSTFAWDTIALGRDADFLRAALNVAAQIVLGLGSAWVGFLLTKEVIT